MNGRKWDFEPNMRYFGRICDRFILKRVKVMIAVCPHLTLTAARNSGLQGFFGLF